MESHGNHPPFNPWDPPFPPPPHNFHWGNPPPPPPHPHPPPPPPHPHSHPHPPPPPPPPHPHSHPPPPAPFPGEVFPQFPPFPDHSFPPADGGFYPPQPHFPRKRKFDRPDDNNYVKLYVAGVPRTVTQDEIYRVFEDHGNVTEVVLLPDKWTGQNHEYCFVKYASTEEADRAITALNNRFTFPGAMLPLKVRYADGTRQRQVSQVMERPMQHESSLPRSGLMQCDSTFPRPEETLHKLYVNGMNREASKEEIEEIFSSYGVVADIYLMRDEMKQNRGCGFIGFTQRYMAVAAINGLNGSYVMKGCDRPLAVRFADPKKPKNGEFRPAPNPVDIWKSGMPDALHLSNSSTTMEANTSFPNGNFQTVANRSECPVSCEMQTLQQPISPSRFSQTSLQNSQPMQGSPQISRHTDSQLHTPLHSNRTSISTVEQQHDHKPCRDTGSDSQTETSEPGPCPSSRSDLPEDPIDCDWSEHICPDGNKYYFNSATFESRWEKPEEFAIYEQRWRNRQLRNQTCPESCPSTLANLSIKQECNVQAAQDQRESCDSKTPPSTMSCAVEHTHEQVQAETSLLGGPAVVQ
ncbi:unnamed protein product [Amaranthus hypochondriacus]